MKHPTSKQEWLDIIADNMVTDEDLDRIIENEELRQNIINLRDIRKKMSTEQAMLEIIKMTEGLKP